MAAQLFSKRVCSKRAVELAVRTPFTIAARVLGVTFPIASQILSRGWAQAGRAERGFGGRVDQARVVGKFAVVAGGRQLRREVDNRLGGVRRPLEERFRSQAAPARNGDSEVVVSATLGGPAPVVAEAAPPTQASPAAQPESSTLEGGQGRRPSLAIPDYDELSASQVTRRLQGMATAELGQVRAYEASNRNRKTVLAAIDRLLP